MPLSRLPFASLVALQELLSKCAPESLTGRAVNGVIEVVRELVRTDRRARGGRSEGARRAVCHRRAVALELVIAGGAGAGRDWARSTWWRSGASPSSGWDLTADHAESLTNPGATNPGTPAESAPGLSLEQAAAALVAEIEDLEAQRARLDGRLVAAYGALHTVIGEQHAAHEAQLPEGWPRENPAEGRGRYRAVADPRGRHRDRGTGGGGRRLLAGRRPRRHRALHDRLDGDRVAAARHPDRRGGPRPARRAHRPARGAGWRRCATAAAARPPSSWPGCAGSSQPTQPMPAGGAPTRWPAAPRTGRSSRTAPG